MSECSAISARTPCKHRVGIVETEDTVSDAAISMFPEAGAIQIIDDKFGDEDWALASAFTDVVADLASSHRNADVNVADGLAENCAGSVQKRNDA